MAENGRDFQGRGCLWVRQKRFRMPGNAGEPVSIGYLNHVRQ
jgi:hypothetical protein